MVGNTLPASMSSFNSPSFTISKICSAVQGFFSSGLTSLIPNQTLYPSFNLSLINQRCPLCRGCHLPAKNEYFTSELELSLSACALNSAISCNIYCDCSFPGCVRIHIIYKIPRTSFYLHY